MNTADRRFAGILPGSVRLQPLPDTYVRWMKSNVRTQRQEGYVSVTARLPLGDIQSGALTAAITDRAGFVADNARHAVFDGGSAMSVVALTASGHPSESLYLELKDALGLRFQGSPESFVERVHLMWVARGTVQPWKILIAAFTIGSIHAADTASAPTATYVLKKRSAFALPSEERAPFWPIGWIKPKDTGSRPISPQAATAGPVASRLLGRWWQLGQAILDRVSSHLPGGAVERARLEGLQGGTPSAAHIHIGSRATNGGVSAFLCAPCPQQGTVTGTITPADVVGPAGQGIGPGEFEKLVRAIRAGHAYANVHTARWPGGEIRGQINNDSQRQFEQ